MKIYLFIAIAGSLLASNAKAQDDCGNSPSYAEFIKCAELKSPKVQAQELEVQKSKALSEQAAKLLNPELTAESFHSSASSGARSETDISLGFPIELGGKLNARKALGEANKNLAEAKLFEEKSSQRKELIIKLHRLRQILHEQEILEEAIGTFSKLIAQYQRQPGLSPEQQVSLSVFRLSKSDNELRLSASRDDVLEIETYFRSLFAISGEQLRKVLPETPKVWPNVDPQKNDALSINERILEAELVSRDAEFSLARSERWPTLTIGPSVKLLTERSSNEQLYGLNVSLPLPVFNFNQAAASAAGAGKKASELRRDFGRREKTSKREELVAAYNRAVKDLTSTVSHEEIEKRHREVERLFGRGIVPSSLVIESHRTSYDLERNRHERELKALDALLSLGQMDGTMNEVNL